MARAWAAAVYGSTVAALDACGKGAERAAGGRGIGQPRLDALCERAGELRAQPFASAPAQPAARFKALAMARDGGVQLVDAQPPVGLGRYHRGRPVRAALADFEHRSERGYHPVRAGAVGLVYDEHVGYLHEAGLHRLHRVAGLRHQRHDHRVRNPHHLQLGLAHADRFHVHDVPAAGVQQSLGGPDHSRQAAVCALGGEGCG